MRRAGLKPMQPMRLHWAPRHGVSAGCSILPDTLCAASIEKRLINLIVSKQLSRLNER